uniref:Uncharacterized protein n=1 Tax=Glossina austeni TaxID=7395 RepID=A0A1A9V434_GLOAU
MEETLLVKDLHLGSPLGRSFWYILLSTEFKLNRSTAPVQQVAVFALNPKTSTVWVKLESYNEDELGMKFACVLVYVIKGIVLLLWSLLCALLLPLCYHAVEPKT